MFSPRKIHSDWDKTTIRIIEYDGKHLFSLDNRKMSSHNINGIGMVVYNAFFPLVLEASGQWINPELWVTYKNALLPKTYKLAEPFACKLLESSARTVFRMARPYLQWSRS